MVDRSSIFHEELEITASKLPPTIFVKLEGNDDDNLRKEIMVFVTLPRRQRKILHAI